MTIGSGIAVAAMWVAMTLMFKMVLKSRCDAVLLILPLILCALTTCAIGTSH